MSIGVRIGVELAQASQGDQIYGLFRQRLQSGWLVDLDGEAIIDIADRKLAKFTQSQPNFISIATPNPVEFVANLMAGWRLGLPIFLTNPQWGKVELAEVARLTAQVDRNQHQYQIMIPTGGSSGEIKFAIHTWETLSASVWGFQEFYGVEQINSVCVLPLYHVSGLMQLWRSLLTNGKLIVSDFHEFCTDPNRLNYQGDIENYFISLVPTQLHKLLDLHPNLLTRYRTILLGGAPPNLELLNQARLAKLPLALTYGMTETASQITSLKPAEFLDGNNHSCGRVLPHVSIELISPSDHGIGLLSIQAKSLMLGYFPDLNLPTHFEPDDLGAIDNQGYLTILGRNSGKIITGGENVFPLEVVNAIMSTGLVLDVWVFGLGDRYWGQIVTAIYVPKHSQIVGETLAIAIAGKISKYKIPKHWLPVTKIPRSSLGKVLIHKIVMN